jgi:CHAT domain-containing protein
MTLTNVLRGVAADGLLAALVLSITPAFAADAFISVGDELAVAKLLGDAATSHPSFWAPFVLVGDGGGAGGAP